MKCGENYQHAHSDQGRYDEYNNVEVFPFVALHAFGIEEFKLWVLSQPDKRTYGFLLWVLPQPDKRTYGFLHTFAPQNMVFMRGNFVHAGAVGTNPREHMDCFPRMEAG